MRTSHLLLAGLIASAVAGSAWAQTGPGGSFGTSKSSGIDFNGATGGTRGAAAGFGSGTHAGSSAFQGSMPGGVSGLPSLGAPPPASAIGSGFGGPPGPPKGETKSALP